MKGQISDSTKINVAIEKVLKEAVEKFPIITKSIGNFINNLKFIMMKKIIILL